MSEPRPDSASVAGFSLAEEPTASIAHGGVCEGGGLYHE
jgi:hypothetical protein